MIPNTSAVTMAVDVPQPLQPLTSAENDSSSYQTPLLPPCRVCGEKASGFHYGANTCEACKGFFRRSLQREDKYNCIGNGDCEITPSKRNTCAYCRYQKCLSLGMSRNAIKTGRYTHQKKTKDIEEVKKIQQQEKLQRDGKIPVLPSNDREKELEKIVRNITAVHMQQTPHTPEFFEKLPQKEKEFLEQRDLQQKMFGTMKPIPRDEYMKIYHSTGMDVDGRREMIKHMIPCIEKAIKRFIAFAKALPGFKDLPLDDQIALIKASRFEAWLISSHKAFNVNHRIFTHVCGYTLHMDGLSSFHDYEFLETTFNIANQMQKLELTTMDECVLKGLCIMSPDRCRLQQPEKVEHSQLVLIEAMQQLIYKYHPEKQHMLAKVISILTNLRTATAMHKRQEERINTEWSEDVKFPPIFYEIFA